MRYSMSIVLLFVSSLVGCNSVEHRPQYASLEDDPRVGAQQTQVCFTRSVRRFSDYQNGDGLLVQNADRQTYLVTFSGPCLSRQYTTSQSLGFTSGLSNKGCLAAGERIFLALDRDRALRDPLHADSCLVRAVYAFDPIGDQS